MPKLGRPPKEQAKGGEERRISVRFYKDDKLFKDFKIKCIENDSTMQDAIYNAIENYTYNNNIKPNED